MKELKDYLLDAMQKSYVAAGAASADGHETSGKSRG